MVAKHHLKPRLDYCRWVLKKQQRTLERFCYTDGTVFFLDRTEEENEQTQRAALGSRVWRQVDGSDGLWGDCVGPSAYSKSQGIPVKIWGMLANGLLFIEILDPGVNMDIPTYTELIEDKFEDWVGSCDMLVCDFEGCLRSKHSVEALEKIGLSLVPGYPKVSQDFNAIENVWNLLRKRLFATLPKGLESRDAFIVRLKAAVKWLNQHKQMRCGTTAPISMKEHMSAFMKLKVSALPGEAVLSKRQTAVLGKTCCAFFLQAFSPHRVCVYIYVCEAIRDPTCAACRDFTETLHSKTLTLPYSHPTLRRTAQDRHFWREAAKLPTCRAQNTQSSRTHTCRTMLFGLKFRQSCPLFFTCCT